MTLIAARGASKRVCGRQFLQWRFDSRSGPMDALKRHEMDPFSNTPSTKPSDISESKIAVETVNANGFDFFKTMVARASVAPWLYSDQPHRNADGGTDAELCHETMLKLIANAAIERITWQSWPRFEMIPKGTRPCRLFSATHLSVSPTKGCMGQDLHGFRRRT